jgi:hypothetical protein
MVPLLIPRRQDWPCLRQDRIILPTLMLTVPGKPPEGAIGRPWFSRGNETFVEALFDCHRLRFKRPRPDG